MGVNLFRSKEDMYHEELGGFKWISWDETRENEKRNKWMIHSDGITWQGISQIEMDTGAMYVERRYTEITDPKWYHRPIYWILNRLS